MIGRRLIAALGGVALVLAVWVPGAAAARSHEVMLTSTATFPGVAKPQTFSLLFEDPFPAFTRVVRHTDPATLVLEDRPYKVVRRGGKKVHVPVKACARGTLSIALFPELQDPVGLARLLVPVAQQEVFEFVRPGNDRNEGLWAARSWRDRGDVEGTRARTNEQLAVEVEGWSRNGLRGLAVTHMHTVRLRRDGVCAPTRTDDPFSDVAHLQIEAIG